MELTRAEIGKRARRFASLRAAQRALSELAHPDDLENMMAQGGELLVQLQALSSSAADHEALGPVDRLLDEMSARTATALDRISISQLRVAMKERVVQHREEVRGLIDVVLDGDVEDPGRLTMLEFLVTLLSSEQHDTGKRMAREPAEVAPRLAGLAARFVADDDPEVAEAEKTFHNAREGLLQAGAIGPTRDRLRQYKKQIGARLLHPRVMSAVVQYNVAMSNRIAGLVESHRSLDALAQEALTSPAVEEAPAASTSVFDSAGFSRLVAALQARVLQEPCEDALAARIVEGYDLGSLAPAELEALETRGDEPIAHLIRTATVLALTVRYQAAWVSELRELAIDFNHLRHDWRRELAGVMTARAQKLLSETRYVEASSLAALKAKNLAAPHGPMGRSRTSPTATVLLGAPEARSDVARRVVRLVALGGCLTLLALLLVSLFVGGGGGRESFSRADVFAISPFLESGHLVEMADTTRFVGKLNRGWQQLELPERTAVISEIGEYFDKSGIHSVVLTRFGYEEARYGGGAVSYVMPRRSEPREP
jgi:hypothetical protein